MSGAEDSDDYRRRLEGKLAPERIRATLAFAGLYQLAHEMLKRSVIDGVKEFFGYHSLDGTGAWLTGDSGRSDYKRSVLDRAPANSFKSSLLWLQDAGALSHEQVVRLDAIYAHRHDLTHELERYIVDVHAEPDIELFSEAVEIMQDIARFWIQVEKDIGTFDGLGEIDTDEVVSGTIALLQLCVQAYADGLPKGMPEPVREDARTHATYGSCSPGESGGQVTGLPPD